MKFNEWQWIEGKGNMNFVLQGQMMEVNKFEGSNGKSYASAYVYLAGAPGRRPELKELRIPPASNGLVDSLQALRGKIANFEVVQKSFKGKNGDFTVNEVLSAKP
jgi:hypothetical protein